MRTRVILFAATLLLPVAAKAADKAGAEAALAAAVKAEDAAGAAGNRWLPAETALKAAHTAMAAGAWDKVVAEATIAEAMGRRAVEQAREQETLWRDAVLK